MDQVLSSYRLVQMENPFEQWNDPLIQQLLQKTMTLRINGYRSKYPNGVLPYDVSSWYATHFLVCEPRGLEPIMGFQRVTLERYRKHYAPFAPLTTCQQAGCERQVRAMQDLVARFEDRPEKLSYTAGFTIDPKLRADRDLTDELCRLMVVLHYFFHQEAGEGHEILTGPTTRFNALLTGYGFTPLVPANGEAADGVLQVCTGEKLRFMRASAFNEDMMRFAECSQSWWDNRILLCGAAHHSPMIRVASARSRYRADGQSPLAALA
jgi:hypothetical protein